MGTMGELVGQGEGEQACNSLLRYLVRYSSVASRFGPRWLLWLALLGGNAIAVDRAGFESVRFQHLGVDQGLSQATVRAMAQDSTGFIWLATQDGLNRYDGYEFRIFRRSQSDPGSLPDNHVLALTGADNGGVWLGMQNGGLALFDPLNEQFSAWPIGDPGKGELASATVVALLNHRWGGLWVASANGQIQYLAEGATSLTPIDGSMEGQFGQVRALREAADGAVLVAASRGLFRIERPGVQPQPVIESAARAFDVNDVAEMFDGSLWVATEGEGLYQINDRGQVLRHFAEAEGLPSPIVRSLLIDRSGRLWIATSAGLARLDIQENQLHLWRGDTPSLVDGLSAPRVQSLFEDRDGLIWIGTWINGANLHDPRTEAFRVARPAAGVAGSVPGFAVVDVERADERSVWMAFHDSARVVRLDLEHGVREELIPDVADGTAVSGAQVRALAQADDGTLWMSLGGADRPRLARRRPGISAVQVIGPGSGIEWNMPKGEIFDLHFDNQGRLWVASVGGGLGSLCRDCSRFEVYRHQPDDPSSLPEDEVYSVFQSASGGIWVGTRHQGLARLDPESGRFQHYPADPANPEALAHASVTVIREGPDGALWVGTQGGGLHRATRDASDRIVGFKRFDRSRGLASDAIGEVLFDSKQRVWVSTTAGISRIDPERQLIENFAAREGAQAAGYFIGSGAAMPDGRLLFGGLRGLTITDTRDVHAPPPPLQVAVSEVRIFGAELAANSPEQRPWVRYEDGRIGLALDSTADDFAIDLTALSYASPDQLQYDYRLDGLHSEWTRTEARRRFAAYTNVPPGDYVFLARASRLGGPSTEPLRFPITIREVLSPGDWVRRLALPFSAVLGLALLGLAAQRQREKRQAQARVAKSEERLKLALWGTGDEMWDLDLRTQRMRRENMLSNLRSTWDQPEGDAGALIQHLHPDDARTFNAAAADLLGGVSNFFDVTYRVAHDKGGWAWLRSRGRITDRDENGRAFRVIGTTSDVTELKAHQQALEDINRELEQRVSDRTRELSEANQSLEEAMRGLKQAQGQLVEQEKMAALGGLVAGVAHEINTPLGIGVTAASHLESATRDFRAKVNQAQLTRSDLRRYGDIAEESADLILRNLRRADKLIKSFKRVAVDQSSEARRRIDLAHYVDEILTSLRPSLRNTRHEVIADLPTGIMLDTLPGAIYQVLSNLLNNSLIHGFAEREDGGLIRIEAAVDHDVVVLRYSDNGCGMSEDVRRHMFEPFFTTRRGAGGSGLGMHIVYNTVTQALGGSIACESTPGEGTLITLRLPLHAGGASEAAD